MKKLLVSVICGSAILAPSIGRAQAAGSQPAPAPAQTSASPAQPTPPAGPVMLSMAARSQFGNIKRNLSEAAAKMPEEHYAFKPMPEVRSFGELVGHVADANFALCARAKGEKSPQDGNSFEKTTAKAELVKALDDSLAYCDGVYGSVTDPSLIEIIKAAGPNNTQVEIARGNSLFSNIAHNNEHYGNIVTYMRLKGLVPPSTERAQQTRRPSGN